MVELKVSEISERLAAQAQAVVAHLLPGAKLHGNVMLCGDVGGSPGESLKIGISGTYAGQWRDWSNDEDKGDLLDLWRLSRGITPAEAIKQAKAFLGIVDPIRQLERKSYSKPFTIDSRPLNDAGKAMSYLRDKRGLRNSTVEAFKIEGLPEKSAIVFPSYSPAGDLVNRSYRTLEKDKRVWQDKDCAPSLFGWQALPESAYKAKTVLLAEGQIDAATWHQWGIPALSIPNGTGCAWIDYEWENLAVFDTIYLAFDQDEAGRKITETVAARLGKHRCMIVSMPKKDANDCLMAGFVAGDAADWITNAKVPKVKRLVTAAEMESRLLAEIAHKDPPFTLQFMARHWPYSGFWFRPGEVTLWGGFAGVGKSTFLNFLKSQLLADQTAIFEASLEMKVETTLRKLATIFNGEKLNDDSARAFVRGAGEYLIFADVVGSMKQEELMEMLWFAFRRYGCAHLMIDSLMRIEELEEDYPAQGQFCNRLQDFAKETGCHVHLVAHLAKPSQTVVRPSMYSIKGSSLMVNNADNVILVNKNPDKEKLRVQDKLTPDIDASTHDAEVTVEKQRETGWTGMFKLKFDKLRGTYRAW
jgi:twinkle protein